MSYKCDEDTRKKLISEWSNLTLKDINKRMKFCTICGKKIVLFQRKTMPMKPYCDICRKKIGELIL
jgi:uncharacterized CHY-type Zn-finger protein